MTCPICGAVNPPGARFCVECGQALPRLCPNCGATNPATARFCNQCGFNLDAAGAEEAPPVSAPAPSEREDEGGDDEETGQRRIVTILFADLTSSTALGEALDAEEMRELLGAFFAAMTQVIHRHGGSVEKYIGDAIMAVFGLPIAHEDDPGRAVRAALEMQGRLRELNAGRLLPDGSSATELRMRVGVNTGEVAAAGAAREGLDFIITGDPVNVAARLQQLAEPGMVLVGPRAYRATRGVIKYRPLEPVALRGKSRLVSIWEAVGPLDNGAPATRPRGLDGARASLVGRGVEMALLDAVSTRVLREKSPHLITVLGAPGVGKTRLARDFMRRMTGVGALRDLATRAQAIARADVDGGEAPAGPLPLEGRCPPYGEDITYWPLTEMLRVYAGFSAMEPPETARAKLLAAVRARLTATGRAEDPELVTTYLATTIGIESAERCATLPSDARQQQEGVRRAWRTFFEAVATGRGLVALIDDAHWADDALLDLLGSVAGQASGVPLLFLLTARPELTERRADWGGGRRNYVTLGLEPLSPTDTRALLDELIPGAGVPDALRESVLDKADGNPFYVEEIVRMLIDRDALTRDDSDQSGADWRLGAGWSGADETLDLLIPDTVQGVLAARLDLLTAAERDVLRHAAVIGRYFWPSALLSLAPHWQPEPLMATLQALRERDLIRVSDRSAIGLAPPGEEVYTFQHALIREVVYSAIPRTRRAHEHMRVAEWLENFPGSHSRALAELLAQHYFRYYTLANLARSRNVERRRETREKVVVALRQAGEGAVSLHALARADTYFSDALDLLASDDDLNDIPTVVALLIARANTRWLAARADDAWGDYREALRAWASVSSAITYGAAAPVSAPAAARSSVSSTSSGRFAAPPAPADGACVVTSLPRDWRQTGMRLYTTLTQLPARNSGLFRQTPPHEELLAYLEEGLRIASELGREDTLDYAELLTAKAFFWWSWSERRGEAELLSAYRSAREAVRIAESLGDARVASEALDALGALQATLSDLTGYLESQQRRLRWAEGIDDYQELVDINTELSQAHQLTGDFAGAVRYATDADDIARGANSEQMRLRALGRLVVDWFEWDHWSEALAAGVTLREQAPRAVNRAASHHHAALLALATISARIGDADSASRLARLTMESGEGTHPLRQEVELGRARLALARGATREARQILLAALDLQAGNYSTPAVMAELAEIAARLSDTDLYERCGPSALEMGWRSGARKALAQAVRARAIVAIGSGRWDDGLADAQAAIRRYSELGCAWEEARSRYALAGLYRRRQDAGDSDLAREELTSALATFERLKSARDTARARAALAGADVRLP